MTNIENKPIYNYALVGTFMLSKKGTRILLFNLICKKMRITPIGGVSLYEAIAIIIISSFIHVSGVYLFDRVVFKKKKTKFML